MFIVWAVVIRKQFLLCGTQNFISVCHSVMYVGCKAFCQLALLFFDDESFLS